MELYCVTVEYSCSVLLHCSRKRLLYMLWRRPLACAKPNPRPNGTEIANSVETDARLAMRVYSYFSFMYPPFYYPHPHQKVLGPSGQLLAPYIGAGPLRTPSRGRTDYTYTVYTPIFALT